MTKSVTLTPVVIGLHVFTPVRSGFRYPIEKKNGFWIVWSMPIEHTIGGDALARGLKIFPSYVEGLAECHRRNNRSASKGE